MNHITGSTDNTETATSWRSWPPPRCRWESPCPSRTWAWACGTSCRAPRWGTPRPAAGPWRRARGWTSPRPSPAARGTPPRGCGGCRTARPPARGCPSPRPPGCSSPPAAVSASDSCPSAWGSGAQPWSRACARTAARTWSRSAGAGPATPRSCPCPRGRAGRWGGARGWRRRGDPGAATRSAAAAGRGGGPRGGRGCSSGSRAFARTLGCRQPSTRSCKLRQTCQLLWVWCSPQEDTIFRWGRLYRSWWSQFSVWM